ncbi:MAG: zinc-finger domain-containing protein [Alphaproteobacteria bacterium]|nr:zinc-finger domain-containing protein [Alphaproteobacteria bacterium]
MSDNPKTNIEHQAEIIYVTKAKISCDGGGGSLGHPKVYLDLSAAGSIDCPYCGRHFVKHHGSDH